MFISRTAVLKSEIFQVKVIRRVHLNGTGQEDVVSSEIRMPDGVAIDWRAENLYWTDSGTDRIQVMRVDTPFIKVKLGFASECLRLNCTRHLNLVKFVKDFKAHLSLIILFTGVLCGKCRLFGPVITLPVIIERIGNPDIMGDSNCANSKSISESEILLLHLSLY